MNINKIVCLVVIRRVYVSLLALDIFFLILRLHTLSSGLGNFHVC